MRILQKRGYTRAGAILFGIKSRAHSCGGLKSLCQTAIIVFRDIFVTIFSWVLRLALFYPFLGISRSIKAVKRCLIQAKQSKNTSLETN
jgi:hypothetical protein